MCNDAKLALANWWILTFVAVMLWYRNASYDRVMSAFIFVLGLVQLIEYGIYNSMNEDQGARILFIVLWLQCLVG
jgi:heme/copper-type cytochrome/quinol oxidase subunit 4